MGWKEYLVAGAAAAGAATVLYYLMREEKEKKAVCSDPSEKGEASRVKAAKPDKASKEYVVELLDEILKAREATKAEVQRLEERLASRQNLSFEEMYAETRDFARISEDPLEAKDISLDEFDQMVTAFTSDPAVKERVSAIMVAPVSENQEIVSIEKLVEIHQAMLEEIAKMEPMLKTDNQRSHYSRKDVALMTQLMVAVKVRQRFNITTEVVEASVAARSPELRTNAQFIALTQEIQKKTTEVFNSLDSQKRGF